MVENEFDLFQTAHPYVVGTTNRLTDSSCSMASSVVDVHLFLLFANASHIVGAHGVLNL
jgi:hypothetical protein